MTKENKKKNISITYPYISRRTVLKLMGLGAATIYFKDLRLLSASDADQQTERPGPDFSMISPIDRTRGDLAPQEFSGDRPDRTHRILWDKQGFIASMGGRLPEPSERVPLVIIGGGMSGLMSAYLLRKYQPIVLERADRFGGNSRGESWNGLDYSVGAAYFMEPEVGSELAGLLLELGVDKLYRMKTEEDPIVWKNRRYDRFWEGETDPKNSAQFRKLHKYFNNTFNQTEGLTFPDIPITNEEKRKGIVELDRMTFKEHLEKVIGGTLHPHIETAMEHFSWSSFGAPFSEISAAAGLNFYAGEFGNVLVTPGGNSAVAECVLKHLLKASSAENLRTRSIVFDVQVVSDGAVVCYEREGKLQSIHAKAVILACPKFAVSRMLNKIEPERAEAIRTLRYHSYLVANVLLNRAIPNDFYDLFLIGEGNVDTNDIAGSSERQKVTDVVLGTFAKFDTSRSILTLYRGMPYPGGRGQLYADGAYHKYKAEFETQIEQSILPLVGASTKDVTDIRLTRWGHPLPMAEAGLIANGTIDTIRKPFRKRVFFVEQDNWMLPAFETATGEALFWAPVIDTFLKGEK